MARHTPDEPVRTVTTLHDELLAHVGGHLHDDAAPLLLRVPAPADTTVAPAASGPERIGSCTR